MTQRSTCSTAPALRDGSGAGQPDRAAGARTNTTHARLTITGLPVTLRPVVETAMAVCLPTPGLQAPPGTDPLTADWCTGWSRSCAVPRGVDCNQPLSGARNELLRLARLLDGLGDTHGFDVELTVFDGTPADDRWTAGWV
ncbi:hypothetical protein M0E78_02950 [Corynebacterium sp. P6145]|uniref:hypothetical protein n=1 Tax=Corynebacterium antarcticum TaxID=2800405 RepID=UPI0020064F87|nr:hypothetical protein [Corynebacterium antarcticum]MCK7641884.1 hypothetical protein [Corynebacterium antarcticum]MCX7491548.1 hypothetical protein [Corynebacterium antarcticum]